MSYGPYRPSSNAPSPYRRAMEIPYEAYQSLPTGPARVGAGATTYSMSTASDGRIIYHLFKAVAASYQTPNGLISGIQWLPAETTSILPPGVLMPEQAGFGVHKEESRALQDWQRTDELRRKQEEKEARRLREMHSRNGSEYDVHLSRERDVQSMPRERRKSLIGSTGVSFPQMGSTIYPSTTTGYPSPYGQGYESSSAGYAGSGNHSRSASVGGYDIAKHMRDMELNSGERERKVSIGGTRIYGSTDASPYERMRTTGGNFSNPYPSPHSYPPASAYGMQHSSSSPPIRPRDFGYGAAGSTGYPPSNLSSSPTHSAYGPPSAGGYPPGHVLYDTTNSARSRGHASRPASRHASRAPSPNLGTNRHSTSETLMSSFSDSFSWPGESQQLPAPEAFSRPTNNANSFSAFDPLRILDLEDIHDAMWKPPKMPMILSTHDIRPDDWNRCIQDLVYGWVGKLPVSWGPGGRPPRKSRLAQDLIELWNASYFAPRGVELVLFKGQHRRTKSQSTKPQQFFDPSDESSDSHSTDFSDWGAYNRGGSYDDRRFEERRRHNERKAKRKAYTVYVACTNPAVSPLSGSMAHQGYPVHTNAIHVAPPSGYPGFIPPPVSYSSPYASPYGPPAGVPKSRSLGHGGGY